MTSGDIGVVFVTTVNDLGYDVPAGSTITFLAKPGYPIVGAAEETYPGSASLDGSTLFYSTQGNGVDFQSGGNWQYRFRVLDPSGNLYTTPPGQTFVNPA